MFKLVDIEQSRLPTLVAKASSNQLKTLREKKKASKQQDFCQQVAFGLELKCQPARQLGSQFLKINPSLVLSIHMMLVSFSEGP